MPGLIVFTVMPLPARSLARLTVMFARLAGDGGIDLRSGICYAACGMDRRLAALALTGVGFFVAGSIVLGVVAGRWVDSRLNSEPLFLIVGLLLGVAVASYGLYTMLRPFLGDRRDKGKN